MDVDCYAFVASVNAQQADTDAIHLLTMSDRSDDDGAMSFGWVIALPNGTRLARCAGPTLGVSAWVFSSSRIPSSVGATRA
jgi:hypothetical protein